MRSLRVPRFISGHDSYLNLERAWEISGGSEDQLTGTMVRISQVVAQQFNKQE